MQDEMWYSPSGLRMRELCPQFRNDNTRDQSAAERGRRIHEAIETAKYDGLDEEEMECTAKFLTYKDEVIGVLVDGATEAYEVKLEYEPLRIRGTADYVQFCSASRSIILADWKTGRKEVEPAEHNFQLQCYAFMLLQANADFERVEVHIVAPLTLTPYSTYVYTTDMLGYIAYRIERASNGIGINPPCAYVGVCDWCGGKAECPAMNQIALLQAEAVPLPMPDSTPANVVVTPEGRAVRQILACMLEDWAKQTKAANVAAVVQDGVEIPGFVLRQREGNMSVSDPGRAIDLLVEDGLQLKALLSAAKLSLPKLADLYMAEKGGSKRENRAELETKLKDVLVRGDPVVFLQKGKPKTKGVLTDG